MAENTGISQPPTAHHVYNLAPDQLSIAYESFARPGQGLDGIIENAQREVRNAYDGEPEWLGFNALWSKLDHLSLLGLKAYRIYKLALRAISIPGNFIECGVFKGGLSFMLAMLLKQADSKKLVYLCDTFEGLPDPDRSVDRAYSAGSMAYGRADVLEHIRTFGIDRQCILKKGLFSKTFQSFFRNEVFALAHIDCDLYAGTKESLEFLYPRLSPGAPVVIDDYYDESRGVMAAVNEFVDRERVVLHLSTHGQVYFINGEEPNSDTRTIRFGKHSVYMSVDAIRDDRAYLHLLESIATYQKERTQMLCEFIRFCCE